MEQVPPPRPANFTFIIQAYKVVYIHIVKMMEMTAPSKPSRQNPSTKAPPQNGRQQTFVSPPLLKQCDHNRGYILYQGAKKSHIMCKLILPDW